MRRDYAAGPREYALSATPAREKGDDIERGCGDLKDTDLEKKCLANAKEQFEHAVEWYQKALGYGSASRNAAIAERGVRRVEARIDDLDQVPWFLRFLKRNQPPGETPPETPPATPSASANPPQPSARGRPLPTHEGHDLDTGEPRRASVARTRIDSSRRIELGLLAAAAARRGASASSLAWYAKTTQAATPSPISRPARAVDLNALEQPDPLVPLLVTFDDQRERRLVAGAIADYVRGTRTTGLTLAGAAPAAVNRHPTRRARRSSRTCWPRSAISRASASPTRELDRRSDAPELRARLATLREGRFNPETIRVLDVDDLRALRPQVVVRSTARVQPAPAGRRASLFVAAFALVHGVAPLHRHDRRSADRARSLRALRPRAGDDGQRQRSAARSPAVRRFADGVAAGRGRARRR